MGVVANAYRGTVEVLAKLSRNLRSGVSMYLVPPSNSAGVRVTEDNALTFSAVYACVKVIAEPLAAVPKRVRRYQPDGIDSDVAAANPVDYLIHAQPNPEQTAFTFWLVMWVWRLLWGNAYAEIERDVVGRPVALWPIEPWRVEVDRRPYDNRPDSGRLFYRVANPEGPGAELDFMDMFHLRSLGDGVVGYSVVRLAQASIALGLASEQYGGAFYGNQGMPGGILEVPGTMSEEKRVEREKNWKEGFSGKNARRVAVLPAGTKYTPLTVPPEDAQFLQTRQFQVTEIARWFRVPCSETGDITLWT